MAGFHAAFAGLVYLCFGLSLQLHGEEPGAILQSEQGLPQVFQQTRKTGAAGGILRRTGCVWAELSSRAGTAMARQLMPLCSSDRYTSAEAAEVIHHPRSLLYNLSTAVLVYLPPSPLPPTLRY